MHQTSGSLQTKWYMNECMSNIYSKIRKYRFEIQKAAQRVCARMSLSIKTTRHVS